MRTDSSSRPRTRAPLLPRAALCAASLAWLCAGCGARVEAAASAPPATDGAASPLVVIGGSEHNFGIVKEGQVLEHSFVFRNAGPTRLALAYGAASCGCTSYSFEPKALDAGASAALSVRLDSAGHVGSFTATVHGVFEEPDKTRHLQAFVVGCIVEQTELVYTSPARVDVSGVDGDRDGRADFAIECKQLSTGCLPSRARLAAAPPAGLVVALEDDGRFVDAPSLDCARSKCVGTLRLAVPAPESARLETVRFELEFPDGRSRALDLPVRVLAAARVDVDPPSFFLGALQPSATRVRQLRVRSASNATERPLLRSSGAEIALSWPEPGLGQTPADGWLEARVEFTAPSRPGDFEGWIEVVDGSKPAQRVPVIGFVQ